MRKCVVYMCDRAALPHACMYGNQGLMTPIIYSITSLPQVLRQSLTELKMSFTTREKLVIPVQEHNMCYLLLPVVLSAISYM